MVTRYEPDAAPVYTRSDDTAPRAPRRRDLLRRRFHRRRADRGAVGRPSDRHRGILHGGPGGCPADGPARVVGVRRGRSGVLFEQAKSELLGVDPALIDAYGAVSEPVAEAMADGALRRFSADTAVAITGIAGPGGGTDDKPVGTVCFCVKLADGTTDVRTMRLPGNRSDVRERSTTVAMHLLRRALS